MANTPNTSASSLSNAAAAFFWQQQFKQANAAPAPSPSFSPAFATAAAQALLKQQEDQLRATRMLLLQRQLDELMASGTSAAGSPRASRSNSILSSGPSASLINLTSAAVMAAAGNSVGQNAITAVPTRSASSTAAAPSIMEAAAKMAVEEDHDDKDNDLEDEEYFKAFAHKNGNGDGEEKPDASDTEDGKAGNESFPHKLYRMLHECSMNPRDGRIVSFLPSGNGFTIHKPKDFVAEIMPRYFTTRRIASFQRQLNLYGFRRISEGKEKGAYFHKDFLKGKRSRIQKIKRKSTAARPSVTAFAQRFSTAPLQFPTVPPASAASLYGQGLLDAAQAAAPVNKDLLLARMAAASSQHCSTNSAASLLELARRGMSVNLPTGFGPSHQDILRNAAASLLFKNSNGSNGPF